MVSGDEPVENAWLRSHARCEGRRGPLPQGYRCGADLVWERRGHAGYPGAWEVYRKSGRALAGWEAVKQIEILCWECYQAVTRSGRPAPQRSRRRPVPSVGPRDVAPARLAPAREPRRTG